MTNSSIERKIAKITAKQAELALQLEELKEQKKLATLSIEHPDIKDLNNLIESTAEKLKTSPKKIIAILSGKTVQRNKLEIKYRDTAPGCENNTWSGRGLAPLWMKRYEAAGRNRNEFLVK